MTWPFGMIKFRNDFKMIFVFKSPFRMIKKMMFIFVMIRGKSPHFRNEEVGQSKRRTSRKELPVIPKGSHPIIPKTRFRCHLKMNG